MHATLKAGAGLALLVAPSLVAPDAAADATTFVPLSSVLRRCDFGQSAFSPQTPRTGYASGETVIRVSGGTVVADVHLVNTDQPGSHYDVSLVQLPRSSAATCGPGDPGVVSAGLDLDGAGQAHVTLQNGIQPGATGAWVNVSRPNPHSQNPQEYYTSQFVVPI